MAPCPGHGGVTVCHRSSLPPWTDARVLYRTKKKHQKHQRTAESSKAHSRGQCLRGKTKQLSPHVTDSGRSAVVPGVATVDKDKWCAAELQPRTSQSKVRDTLVGRNSLSAFVHAQGHQSRDAWLCGAATPSRNVCDLDPDTRTKTA